MERNVILHWFHVFVKYQCVCLVFCWGVRGAGCCSFVFLLFASRQSVFRSRV